MIRSARQRKCKVCGSAFTPFSSTAKVCGVACAVEHSKQLAAKKDRAETKARKEAIKPLRDRLKDAEKVVNQYVRLRDADDGCISCDKPAHWDGQWHASHFKSVGSNSALRFNLWNINKACSQCNLFLSGNIAEYEKRLVLKIGAEKVEWLKCQNSVKKYEPEYLERLKSVFAKKVRRLQKRRAA